MAKQMIFGDKARNKIFSGVTQLNDAVKATLGPKGRNVVIATPYGVMVTKDGVTVARAVELQDNFENVGAQLVKQAANKTNDLAGDGTTTATLLAHAMMEQGMKYLSAGSNAILIKKGIDMAVEVVGIELEKLSKKVNKKEEYEAVATISAQDKEIGSVIAGVIEKVGKNGVITVEAGNTMGLEVEISEGMQFDNGFLSPYMVTDQQKMEAVHRDVLVLVTENKIMSNADIIPVLEAAAAKQINRLLIIAESVEGEALATLVVNNIHNRFFTVAVRAPMFGERRKEMLRDIAILTGATVVSAEVGSTTQGVFDVTLLGKARSISVNKDRTTIVGGGGSKKAIKERLESIQTAISESKSEYETEGLKIRAAKLSDGVAVVKVGAATEVEQKERQHRVEDALSATRAAAEEGIVPGGGTAYIRCIPALEKLHKATQGKDEKAGIEIVMKSIEYPTKHIADNAGFSGDVVVSKTKDLKKNDGFNALTGEYEDLVEGMVIDPKKVTRSALENAASVASMFLTLEVAMTELPPPVQNNQQPVNPQQFA